MKGISTLLKYRKEYFFISDEGEEYTLIESQRKGSSNIRWKLLDRDNNVVDNKELLNSIRLTCYLNEGMKTGSMIRAAAQQALAEMQDKKDRHK